MNENRYTLGTLAEGTLLAKYCPYLGFIYISLIPFNVIISGQFLVHDLLAPLMALCIVPALFQNRTIFRRPPIIFFSGFLLVAAFLSFLHYQTMLDLYEYSIYAYMIILFLFFFIYSPTNFQLRVYGVIVILSLLLYFFAYFLPHPTTTDSQFENSTLSFATKRWTFPLGQPNMMGSFFVLPITCFLLGFNQTLRNLSSGQLLIFVASVCCCCLPLFFTISKDMLLSLAVIGGWLFTHPKLPCRQLSKSLLVAGLLSIFLVFYLNVIFPVFPVQRTFPYINTNTFGLYMIDQGVYLKIVLSDTLTFLIGSGKSVVKEMFATFADKETISDILRQYNMLGILEGRIYYRDSHNEYLNLTATFGVIAALLLYLGITTTPSLIRAGSYKKSILTMTIFFLVALLLVSLWRDILSKRWIWVTLGIMISFDGGSDKETERKNGVWRERLPTFPWRH
jgi:hypothetical protein